MDQNKLLQIIQKNLDELSEIHQELSQNQQLSKFEIDLALNKARLIYQEYGFLLEIHQSNTNEIPLPDQIITPPAPPPITPVQAEASPEKEIRAEIEETQTAETTKDEEIEIEIPRPQPVYEEVQTQDKELTTKQEKSNPTPEVEVNTSAKNGNNKNTASGTKMMTDQFQSRSLNDLLSATNKLDQHFANSPIQKLENAIGLNDRFQYIRELFQNDADLFRDTIHKIDRMHTLEEAIDHLDNQFEWEKDDTCLKFVHLVKRRFAN